MRFQGSMAVVMEDVGDFTDDRTKAAFRFGSTSIDFCLTKNFNNFNKSIDEISNKILIILKRPLGIRASFKNIGVNEYENCSSSRRKNDRNERRA